MQKEDVTPVGPLLRLVGWLSRSTPYFRGKWRPWEWAFNKYFKHGNKSETIRLKGRIRMECDLWDEIQFGLWAVGFQYEVKESRWLRSRVRPGMVFLDVGANVGCYSLMLSPLLGEAGAVHAFEPVSGQYQRFCQTVRNSGLRNLIINKLIVSDRAGKMTINVGADDNSGTASVAIVSRRDRLTETVEAVTLDDYVNSRKLARVDVIKIDVQGHELPVLRGALKTLQTRRPLLLIEIHSPSLKDAGSSREEIYDFLGRQGFEAFAILRNGQLKKLDTPQDGTLIVFSPRESTVSDCHWDE